MIFYKVISQVDQSYQNEISMLENRQATCETEAVQLRSQRREDVGKLLRDRQARLVTGRAAGTSIDSEYLSGADVESNASTPVSLNSSPIDEAVYIVKSGFCDRDNDKAAASVCVCVCVYVCVRLSNIAGMSASACVSPLILACIVANPATSPCHYLTSRGSTPVRLPLRLPLCLVLKTVCCTHHTGAASRSCEPHQVGCNPAHPKRTCRRGR